MLHNLLLEPIVSDDEIIIFHHNYRSKIRFGNPKGYVSKFLIDQGLTIYQI